MRDHDGAHLGSNEFLHAAGDDLQRVDVEPGVGLVEQLEEKGYGWIGDEVEAAA